MASTEDNGLTHTFEWGQTNASIVNQFRKTLFTVIPTMCISQVCIEVNTSIMDSDILAHRLSLVPLRMDARRFERPDTYPNTLLSPTTDAWGDGAVILELSFTTSRSRAMITADELKDAAGRSVAVYPTTPIVPIKAGQIVRLKALCLKGAGRDHARFNPVTVVCVAPAQELNLRYQPEDAVAFVAAAPPGCYAVRDGRVVRTSRVCYEDWRDACVDERNDHAVTTFQVRVESTGVYTAQELVTWARGCSVMSPDAPEPGRTLVQLQGGRTGVLVATNDDDTWSVRDLCTDGVETIPAPT